jgi:hypothetical protein
MLYLVSYTAKFCHSKTMNILSRKTCSPNLNSSVNLCSFLRVYGGCPFASLRGCANKNDFAQRRRDAESFRLHFLLSYPARFRLAKGMIMILKYLAMKNPLRGVNFPSFRRVCA